MTQEMRGPNAMLRWAEAMLAGDGEIECGAVWDYRRGWRTYMRSGKHVLMLAPRAMRKLGEAFRDASAVDPAVRELAKTMVDCANDVTGRIDRHDVPAGAVAYIPHQGTA